MTPAPLLGDARSAGVEPGLVVLASASASRRRLLANAGLSVRSIAPRIDEAEVKRALRAERASPARIAETLAELKAQRVSRREAGVLVIGADQILECDGELFDKPSDPRQAASQLRALSGKRHGLITAACVVRDQARIWHHQERSILTMRRLDDGFIADYLDSLGNQALTSVGAYHLEGLGAQLFTRVEGDFFSILGLPLLPLLGFLRDQKVLAA